MSHKTFIHTNQQQETWTRGHDGKWVIHQFMIEDIRLKIKQIKNHVTIIYILYLYLYLYSLADLFRLKAFVAVVAVVAEHCLLFFFTGVGCCTTPPILRTSSVTYLLLVKFKIHTKTLNSNFGWVEGLYLPAKAALSVWLILSRILRLSWINLSSQLPQFTGGF